MGSSLSEMASLSGTLSNQIGGGDPSDYNQLSNLPKINGRTVKGNLSSEDIGLTKNYEELSNLPKINGHAVKGNLSEEDLGIKPGYDAQLDPEDNEHLILSF